MGLTHISCGGIHRSWCLCSTREEGLDRLVWNIRNYRCRDCNADSIFHRPCRYCACTAYSHKASATCAPVDDFLGILDCAYSSDRRYANLGLCRTFRKLGCTACVTSYDRLAPIT